MKPLLLAALPAIVAVSLLARTPERASGAPVPTPDRSPTDLALSADGRLAVTANNTADSASLVDVAAGKVVAEVPVGKRPFAVALTADGKRALVTNSWGNSVSVLDVTPAGLKPVKTIAVGDEPRGVALSRDGARAFVALAGEASVAVLDLKTLAVVKRFAVGQEPWHLALTPDGSRLAVGNTRGRTVSVLDARTGQEAYDVRVLGRNLRHVAVSPDGKWAYFPAITERGLGVTRPNIDRGWVVGNRLVRVSLTEKGPREAITLDTSGKAVGDLDGVAISPDGQTLALTAGGTHELILMRLSDLPFIAYGGPGDHIDPELASDRQRFRRVPLGGRPLGTTFTPDGKQVLVANYLDNAVQVVDVKTGQISRSIRLGGPSEPSLARKGEALFMDAGRSFGQWYSCNTCHTEGHSNGGNFDTLNDGGYGKPKKTLSLRGVAETAPYTWHGWQKSLRDGIHDSMVKSMQGPEPTAAELDAMEAYFKILAFRPSPYRNPDGTLTTAAKRGQAVFTAKACVSCHGGTNFTNPVVVTAGLEEDSDVHKGFNPPPLRGVYARAPYLHDGRADTLEEVLTQHHRPSQLTGKPDCTPAELADLVAYLKSL